MFYFTEIWEKIPGWGKYLKNPRLEHVVVCKTRFPKQCFWKNSRYTTSLKNQVFETKSAKQNVCSVSVEEFQNINFICETNCLYSGSTTVWKIMFQKRAFRKLCFWKNLMYRYHKSGLAYVLSRTSFVCVYI